MFRLLKIMAFTYGIGVLMLVGWRDHAEKDGEVIAWILYWQESHGSSDIYRIRWDKRLTLNVTQQNLLILPTYKVIDQTIYFFSLDRTSNTYNAYRVELDGSQYKPSSLPMVDFTVSPDNDWIFYDNPSLYRMRLKDLKSELVFQGIADLPLIISNDQEWILFSAYGDIYLVAWDRKTIKNLTNSPTVNEANSLFSPDGKFILYEGYKNLDWDLYLLPIDESSPINLTSTLDGYAYLPQVSIDEQSIFFISKQEDNSYLYRVSLDGTRLQQLFVGVDTNLPPQISGDGQWIIFNSYKNGAFQIYRIRPDGSDLSNLSGNFTSDHFALLSPKGEWIIFSSFRDPSGLIGLYRMRINGSEVERLTPTSTVADFPSVIPLPPMPFHTKNLLTFALGIMTIAGVLKSRRNMVR
jgi:Tol biopolymer transport system component